MTVSEISAAELVERLKRKAPEYLDLVTAETDDDFEKAFTGIIDVAMRYLEQNSKNFVDLKEDGLSAALAGRITIPGLTVSQEKNSNGHVDITIEADHCTPARVKLGEAKIYDGPAYHIKGISQLLGRYTTGRESAGFLLIYVREANIKQKIEDLEGALNEKRPENQVGKCKKHTLQWSLQTKHRHSSGEVLDLSHLGCNLHRPGGD